MVQALSVADRTERLSIAEARLARAVSLAADHIMAHFNLGPHLYEFDACAPSPRRIRASARPGSRLRGRAWISRACEDIPRPSEETEAHVQEAMRFSSRDPLAMHCLAWAGLATLLLGFDERRSSRTSGLSTPIATRRD
jgi:hypothetical protein